MTDTDRKEIRFIDSDYNNLFRIRDGDSIMLTFADGYKEERVCRYIDDYHAYIGDNCFHICEFAERMERGGIRYAPKDKPFFLLESADQNEYRFSYNADENSRDRGCIGHLRADFDSGRAFFSTWFGENDALKTQVFKDEFDDVINQFRGEEGIPLLRSRQDMQNVCRRLQPDAYLMKNECVFKVQSDLHTYFFRCKLQAGDYDLYAYCYNREALEAFKSGRCRDTEKAGKKRRKREEQR